MLCTFPLRELVSWGWFIKGQPINSYSGFSFKVVPENGFEVFRRVFVDFEGISLRRKFLNGLEPENIHMMIGMTWAFGCWGRLGVSLGYFLIFGYKTILCVSLSLLMSFSSLVRLYDNWLLRNFKWSLWLWR